MRTSKRCLGLISFFIFLVIFPMFSQSNVHWSHKDKQDNTHIIQQPHNEISPDNALVLLVEPDSKPLFSLKFQKQMYLIYGSKRSFYNVYYIVFFPNTGFVEMSQFDYKTRYQDEQVDTSDIQKGRAEFFDNKAARIHLISEKIKITKRDKKNICLENKYFTQSKNGTKKIIKNKLDCTDFNVVLLDDQHRQVANVTISNMTQHLNKNKKACPYLKGFYLRGTSDYFLHSVKLGVFGNGEKPCMENDEPNFTETYIYHDVIEDVSFVKIKLDGGALRLGSHFGQDAGQQPFFSYYNGGMYLFYKHKNKQYFKVISGTHSIDHSLIDFYKNIKKKE